jgi:hypothetical protein
MKLTVSQLRRIIKEEVQSLLVRRTPKKNLSESHTKITSRELEEWKKGNWMFEATDEASCSECGAAMQYEGDSCSECGAPMTV